MTIDNLIITLWPQLVALVMIAWLIARLSEKVSQAEKKIETIFILINKMREEWYKKD